MDVWPTGKDVWRNHNKGQGPVSLVTWLSLERSEWQGRKFNKTWRYPHYAGEIKKQRFHCESASNIFRSHYDNRNEKTQQSPFILNFCLRSTRTGREKITGVIVFEMLHFRDGSVCTVGLGVEIKLRFSDGSVCTVGLGVEIKLRFRDGLVCTVGLSAEIKLRFLFLCVVWTGTFRFTSVVERRSVSHAINYK